MLIKTFFTFSFVLLLFTANSQSIIIDYEFEINDAELPSSSSTSRHKLYNNTDYSLYVLSNTNYYQDSSLIQVDKKDGYQITTLSDEHTIIESNNKAKAFLDMKSNKLYGQAMISTKTCIVEDDFPLMNWVLVDQDTTYLNMSCKIAKTEFRGHSWTVFFTDSLGFNAAPWKLYGLPGTVVYGVTSDSRFTLRATGIVVYKDYIEIINPYKDIAKKYSWEEYRKEYKDFMRRYLKSMKSSGIELTVKSKPGLEDVEFD